MNDDNSSKISCPKCGNVKTIDMKISADDWDNLLDEERNRMKEETRNKHMLREFATYRPFTKTIRYKMIEGIPPKQNISKCFSTNSILLGYTKEEWEQLTVEQQECAKEEIESSMSKMNVSTSDSSIPYEVIGPVYYQINNRDLFSDEDIITQEYTEYFDDLNQMLANGQENFGWFYGNYSIGENCFDIAFYIAVEELKKRAILMGADAIICMKQDIKMEIDNNFFLQMYGTAIKYKA